jgi:NAD(P)-dependent dehydrogenase (short-subunit alcohol dehydrogenase family)
LFAPLNPPLPAWPDARVWIVGASTGIGAETAKLMLARGARVALSARSAEKLSSVAGDALAAGRAIVEPLDFTDASAVDAAWTRIVAAWGSVDLVLIVAGTHEEMRAWELTGTKGARASRNQSARRDRHRRRGRAHAAGAKSRARSASSRRWRVMADCRRR